VTIRGLSARDQVAVGRIVSSVLAEYGLPLDPAGIDADLADPIASYVDRGGVFLVVEDTDARGEGSLVGCGGLFPLSAHHAEIRKMYLLPAARHRGVGRRLLEDLVAAARARGFARLTLETASVLKDAIRLYQRFGFVEFTPDHLANRCDRAFKLEL
jgi:putative acetyltransferase